MKLLLFMFLVGYAVKCDDSNYYVIEMPVEDTPTARTRNLQIYWNVPTMQCRSKKIPFENLHQFGIIQNKNDDFRGERIVILYDPGFFPALFRNETSGQLRYRNGGVPQEGNLEQHLKSFKIDLEKSIPDENFNGIGIIDFESWRPIFRQNFGEVHPYQSVSYEIEYKRHPLWIPSWRRAEAKQRFEEAARIFMQNTVSLAKQLRPRARWGYYGFPYCFNMAKNNPKESCADKVNAENDQIDWLWMESTALYPSVYSSQELTTLQLRKLIRGRIREAARVRRPNTPILPYFWFRYRDGDYLSGTDLNAALQTFNQSEASGFLIWGSSNDVNTVDKCQKLHKYIYSVFGPAIAKYTSNTRREHDEYTTDDIDNVMTENYETTPTTTTINDNNDNNKTLTSENTTSSDFTDATNTVTFRELENTSTTTTTEATEEDSEEEIVSKSNDNKTDSQPVDFKTLMNIVLSKIFDTNNTENLTDLEHKITKKMNNFNITSAETITLNDFNYTTTHTEGIATSTYKVTLIPEQILNSDDNKEQADASTESTSRNTIVPENTGTFSDKAVKIEEIEDDQNMTPTDNLTISYSDKNMTNESNQNVAPTESSFFSSDDTTVGNSKRNMQFLENTVVIDSTYPTTNTETIKTITYQVTLPPEHDMVTGTESIMRDITSTEFLSDNFNTKKVISENDKIKASDYTTVGYSSYSAPEETTGASTYKVTLAPKQVLNNDDKITSTEIISPSTIVNGNSITVKSVENQTSVPTAITSDFYYPTYFKNTNNTTTNSVENKPSTYEMAASPELALNDNDMKEQGNDKNIMTTTRTITSFVPEFRTPEITKNITNSDNNSKENLHLPYLYNDKDEKGSKSEPVTIMSILQSIKDNIPTEVTQSNTNSETLIEEKNVAVNIPDTNSTGTDTTLHQNEITTEDNNIFFNQDTLFSQDFIDNNAHTSASFTPTMQYSDEINITDGRHNLSDSKVHVNGTEAIITKDKVQVNNNDKEESTNEDIPENDELSFTTVPESFTAGTTSEQVVVRII